MVVRWVEFINQYPVWCRIHLYAMVATICSTPQFYSRQTVLLLFAPTNQTFPLCSPCEDLCLYSSFTHSQASVSCSPASFISALLHHSQTPHKKFFSVSDSHIHFNHTILYVKGAHKSTLKWPCHANKRGQNLIHSWSISKKPLLNFGLCLSISDINPLPI